MMRNGMRSTIGAACVSLLLVGVATAQSAPAPLVAGAGATLQSYRFAAPEEVGIETISLLSVPFGARATVLGRTYLEVGTAYARGTLTRSDGRTSEIAGLTDTEVRIGVPLAGDALLLSGVVLLPTGVDGYTAAEADVAGAIAADLLPFRISGWGSGGGAGGGITYARAMGGFGVAMGVTYVATREYEPIASDEPFVYQPGNQLHARLLVDRSLGRAGKVTLQLRTQHRQEDRLAGANLYRAGDRYEAMGSYAFPVGERSSGLFYAGGLHRGAGTALAEIAPEMPAQTLMLAGAGLRVPLGEAVLLPSADLRLLRSEDGVGQGYVGGAGAMAELPVGALTVVPTLRARFGRVLVRQDAESGFTGVDAGITVRFGRRQ